MQGVVEMFVYMYMQATKLWADGSMGETFNVGRHLDQVKVDFGE